MDGMRKIESLEPDSSAAIGRLQLRPRGSNKESALGKHWFEMLAGTEAARSRIRGGELEKNLQKVLEEALPGEGPCLGDMVPPERYLPAVKRLRKPTEIDDFAGAERIWSHTLHILEKEDPRTWPAHHQVVRLLVQNLSEIIYPEGMATHRHAPGVEFAWVAALGMNELLYGVRFPDSERSRMLRHMLAPEERKGLSSTKLNRSKQWRQAIRRIILRQRCVLMGGDGYDELQKIASVDIRSSNQAVYLGFALEWRKGERMVTGFAQRNIEHGEKTARKKRPGAGAHRYNAWRRRRLGTLGCLAVRRE